MQREVRRPPQAVRGLHLLRLHAGPDLRHRGAQPDAGRAEEDRPAIYRLSRKPAPEQHRGGLDGQATTAARATAAGTATRRAAGGVANRSRKNPGAGSKPGQAGRADQGFQLRKKFLLLRMAATFAKQRRSEEAVQPGAEQRDAEQAEGGLRSSVVPAKAGTHTPRPALLEEEDNDQRANAITAGGYGFWLK